MRPPPVGSKVGAKTALCLLIAAARLVLLALAIVAEHVASWSIYEGKDKRSLVPR
ncbi:hypothetical protein BHE74_00022056 [Ensete ventricosum]|uniref:Uncharacterized protein n=1 Tax=Ensete ventricosum TaxID=4639 RepID=A0A444EP35_ENSVE|nr:hypothetical protein B296_00042966 [Ensete ventricosum]RWW12134.1 hypothetical protein GW17_00024209 [Ensete ventricosum]RWW70276.1 hypothetical protein BHE74_00022056 [Ensete ventricosum]RZR75224.1 hypothetical protein BHM03_00052114 [Ensete ventricosum]